MPTDDTLNAAPSLTRGRLCIFLAAVLWSTSGAFTKLLTEDTQLGNALGVSEPKVEPLLVGSYRVPVQIAFYRVFFAGLMLAPLLRRANLSFRRLMVLMLASFAVMNALFISAQGLGPAANAILLQYTAPMWLYLASVCWLGEPADRRSTIALAVGLVGMAVILAGGWSGEQLPVVLIALGSGVTYAGVLLCLRVLRGLSPVWMTVWNHLGGALVLLPLVVGLTPPTPPQLALLVVFGVGQMALAYWLVARGLRVVSPQEAGTITLLEPILNPLWAYLVSPATEAPGAATLVGGSLIVGALAWRYWPARRRPDR